MPVYPFRFRTYFYVCRALAADQLFHKFVVLRNSNVRTCRGQPQLFRRSICMPVGSIFFCSHIKYSQKRGVNRHTARCISPVSVVSQCKLVLGRLMAKEISAPYGPYGSGRTSRYLGFAHNKSKRVRNKSNGRNGQNAMTQPMHIPALRPLRRIRCVRCVGWKPGFKLIANKHDTPWYYLLSYFHHRLRSSVVTQQVIVHVTTRRRRRKSTRQ